MVRNIGCNGRNAIKYLTKLIANLGRTRFTGQNFDKQIILNCYL